MYNKIIIRIFSVIGFLTAFSNGMLAQQEVENKGGNAIFEWTLHNILFVFACFVILAALIVMWRIMNLLMDHYQLALAKSQGIDLVKETAKKRPSYFKSLYDKAWSLVPMDREADIDLGHDYDGIRELDNKLPPWWLYLFYGTIVWGVVYGYVTHFSDYGKNQVEEYEMQMEVAAALKLDYLASLSNAIDETNVELVTDAKLLADGESLFMTQCAVCHGKEGEGTIGPNFTDSYWIHGGAIDDLFKTIKYGVPEKGMISWQSQLSPSSMQNVASYILTLEGTNPANPKDPEGDLYVRDAESTGN